MERREHKFQLIGNRFTAVVAVCLTGFLAAWDLFALFSGAPHRSGWLIPSNSLPLPIWGVIILNFSFYSYMLWIAFCVYRGTHGKERVVVGAYCTAALLGLLGRIKALDSPRAVTSIRSVQSVGMSVAFFAALLILWRSPAWRTEDAKSALRLSLFLRAFVLFTFVVGALLYWTL